MYTIQLGTVTMQSGERIRLTYFLWLIQYGILIIAALHQILLERDHLRYQEQ